MEVKNQSNWPIKETKVGSEPTGKDIDDPDSDWYRDRIKLLKISMSKLKNSKQHIKMY